MGRMLTLLIAPAALLAAPALAAGPEPAAPSAVVAPADELAPGFTGPYLGGSVGYGALDATDAESDLDDFVGADLAEERFDLDQGDIAYGLHAGYDLRRGAVVFGPELALLGAGAEVGGVSNFGDDLPEERVEVSVNYGARLALRGGVARGRTLFYGTLGAAYLDLSLDTDGVLLARSSVDFDGWGYAAGLGVERQVVDRVSFGAQYTLHRVEDAGTGGGQGADIKLRMLDLRLSLRF